MVIMVYLVGKIEESETPEETSIREFKEETGITILYRT